MVTQITPLPTPPSRQRPTEFSNEADAFLGALPDFGTEANTLAQEVEDNAVLSQTGASTATTQASIATTQAEIATTQAGIATTQAEIATDAASDASDSAIQASRLNLGAKSTPPTVDNQGSPLLTGAIYYDTTLQKWRSWNGTAWVDPVNVTAGVESISGQSGVLTLQQIGAVEESTILARMQATSLYF